MRATRLPLAIVISLGLHFAAGAWFWVHPAPDSLPLPAPTQDALAWADVELAAPAGPPQPAAPRVVVQKKQNAPSPVASNDPLAPASASSGAFAGEAEKFMQSEQSGKAMQTLRLCLQSDPRNAECHLLLGKLYASRDDYEAEAIEYRAFLRYAPAKHPAIWWVKDILAEHDFNDGLSRQP